MDSQYVSRTLGRCLSEGLAELIELRPLDPIEFLALWIRKYNHNQKLELQKAAHQRELEEEQRRVREDTLHQETLQEEQNQIRAAQPRETAGDPGDHTESEAVIECNDQVIESNDQVIESNDQVIEPNDQVIEPNDQVIEPNDQVIEPNDQVIEPNDQVIEPNDQVIEPNDQVIEPNDQEENPAEAAGEEQTSDILNTEVSLSQQDLRDTPNESTEADALPEETEPAAGKTEEDSDERPGGKEEVEEDDGA